MQATQASQNSALFSDDQNRIQNILRTSHKNAEVLRISDLVTNASQENRLL